jgi:microcystin-dependent protein
MTEPYLGEIRRVAFSFAPRGWALCNGQLLPIATNQALFSLLGTLYGGDGRNTFALPDLRGRSPIHTSDPALRGTPGGEVTHTLTQAEMPAHTHQVQASSAAASTPSPQGAYWAELTQAGYGSGATGTMAGASISHSGGGQPHENRSPFLVVTHIIALTGAYPSRN